MRFWHLSIHFVFFITVHSLAFGSDQRSLATFDECYRILLLDGSDGTVGCRIYGNLMTGSVPRFSDHWRLEFAIRSLLRMNNLTCVRGEPGASMVGPMDYLGNLENPHQYLYTIELGSPPRYFKQPIGEEQSEVAPLKELDSSTITIVKAHWISGEQKELIEQKRLEYSSMRNDSQYTIFPNPGILELDRPLVELNYFDPIGVNLSAFKARLVENCTPFQITKKELPSRDDYRVITYLYESGYADWQVQHGVGLFLEKHQFSQIITPLTSDSKGFVILGRERENPEELELIGIQIPYGYSLIIEDGSIHGDTPLKGLFSMGMTSSHISMRSADAVFLKYYETKENVKIVLNGAQESSTPHLLSELSPIVVYKNRAEEDRQRLLELIQEKSFIFNPFSREYRISFWNSY